MSTVSKDQSIITQVAAKIAADLTPKTDDLNGKHCQLEHCV
jgi:hypothetical protein